MPINPQIPLATRVPQLNDPVQRMGQMADLETKKMQSDLVRQQRDDQELAKSLMNKNATPESGIDMKAVRDELYEMGRADIVVKLDAEEANARSAELDRITKELELQGTAYTLGSKIASGATDQGSWDMARTELMRMFPDQPPLPVEYDKQVVERLVTVGETASQTQTRRREASELAKEALEDRSKSVEALGKWLKTTNSQEEWDGALDAAKFLGFPEAVMEFYGFDYSPEAVARAGQMAGNPPKELLELIKSTSDLGDETRMRVGAYISANNGQMPDEDEVARIRNEARAAVEASRTNTERLVQVIEDGKRIWRRESEAAGGQAPSPARASGQGANLTPGQNADLEQWRLEKLDEYAGDDEMLRELEATYMRALNGGSVVDDMSEGKAVQSPSGKWIIATELRQRVRSFMQSQINPATGAPFEGTEDEIQIVLGSKANRDALGIE